MSDEGTIEARINPLYIPGFEWERAEDTAPAVVETTLPFLCPPGTPNDAKSLKERYKTISAAGEGLFFAPTERGILEKVVWPLRNAMASYVLGNNLGVVALCGVVAEMVALLWWQLEKPELNGKALTENDETDLFGSSFEKLGQYRRVNILRGYSIVSKDVWEMFEKIRVKRNKYLHRWSEDHVSLSKDAEDCFRAATGLVIAVTGLDFLEGTILLNPKLLEHLEEEGIFQRRPDSASTDVE